MCGATIIQHQILFGLITQNINLNIYTKVNFIINLQKSKKLKFKH